MSTAASALSSTIIPDWDVNFSLGEDVRDERRLEQDREWAQAISDGRVHLSHREFALLYGQRFKAAMADYYLIQMMVTGLYTPGCALHRINELLLSFIIEYALPGQGPLVYAIVKRRSVEDLFKTKSFLQSRAEHQHFRVCLRKRPLLSQEVATGAYDVTAVTSQNTMLLHEGKLARNGRLLSMTHHHVAFDHIFDQHTTNSALCADAVEPLVQRALQGHQSTLLCFGQTGTGKTYTLYGALDYIAGRLVGQRIRLLFYEVHGKKCYDLLQQRKLVHLRFDAQEEPQVRGSTSVVIPCLQCAADLQKVLQDALSLRASLVTERNPISSRSHAVCSVEILAPEGENPNSDDDGVTRVSGKITLVDLAGSERNYETQQMSGAMHRESADINLALMSLKNCFRAYHAQESRIPYRDSTLTKVLKRCFAWVSPTNSAKSKMLVQSDGGGKALADHQQPQQHYTTIIATISPTPVDLLHSLNTVHHVLLMARGLHRYTSSVAVEVPKTSLAALSSVPVAHWNAEQVQAWIATVERGRFSHVVLPQNMTGEGLCALSVLNMADLFAEAERHGRQTEGEGPRWVITTAVEAEDIAVAAEVAGGGQPLQQLAVVDGVEQGVADGQDNNAAAIAAAAAAAEATNSRLRTIALALFHAVRREEHWYRTHHQQHAQPPMQPLQSSD